MKIRGNAGHPPNKWIAVAAAAGILLLISNFDGPILFARPDHSDLIVAKVAGAPRERPALARAEMSTLEDFATILRAMEVVPERPAAPDSPVQMAETNPFEAQVTASPEAVDGQVQDEVPGTMDLTALSPQDGGEAGGAEDPTSEAAAMPDMEPGRMGDEAIEAEVAKWMEAVISQIQEDLLNNLDLDVSALSPLDAGAAGGAEDPTSDAAALLDTVLGGAVEAVLFGQDTASPEAVNSQIQSGD
jgi:hypothetical protein